MSRPKKELLHIDDRGRVDLPAWVWERLLKMSGSRATTEGGRRRAVRKMFHKLIWEYLEKK